VDLWRRLLAEESGGEVPEFALAVALVIVLAVSCVVLIPRVRTTLIGR
jgi:hypothetical protein